MLRYQRLILCFVKRHANEQMAQNASNLDLFHD